MFANHSLRGPGVRFLPTFRLAAFLLPTMVVTNLLTAAPITVPPDLAVGDQYRLFFVTSMTRNATSSDISDYNAFVSAVAATVPELAALGTTWNAVASTTSVDARNNTYTNPSVAVGVPIYSLAGFRLANDNADLWDGLIVFVGNDLTLETGDPPFSPGGDVEVFTGTTTDGMAAPGTALGEMPTPQLATIGITNLSGPTWISAGSWPNDDVLQFYGISGVLTVVPEPSTVLLFIVGAIGAGACQIVVAGLRQVRCALLGRGPLQGTEEHGNL